MNELVFEGNTNNELITVLIEESCNDRLTSEQDLSISLIDGKAKSSIKVASTALF